jgi:hypothetical protein
MSIGYVRCEPEPSASRWGERAQNGRRCLGKSGSLPRLIHSELVNGDPLALFKG